MDRDRTKTRRIGLGLGRLWRDERGSGAAEYALIIGSLGLAVVLGSSAIKLGVKSQIDSDATTISASNAPRTGNGTGNGNGNGNGTPTPSPTATPTPTPAPTATPTPGPPGCPGNKKKC